MNLSIFRAFEANITTNEPLTGTRGYGVHGTHRGLMSRRSWRFIALYRAFSLNTVVIVLCSGITAQQDRLIRGHVLIDL